MHVCKECSKKSITKGRNSLVSSWLIAQNKSNWKDLYENNELRYFSIVSVGGKKYGFRVVSEEFSIITGEDVLQGKKTKICLWKIPLEIFQNPLVENRWLSFYSCRLFA